MRVRVKITPLVFADGICVATTYANLGRRGSMKTTRQAWFYPVVLAYAVIRSLLLVALAVSRGTSTDWLFVPIPVIWSLIPIAAIGRLSSQLPPDRQNFFSAILVAVNIAAIFIADYLCFCVKPDAQNGLVIFLSPFVLLCFNCLVFVTCISWHKVSEWLAEKRNERCKS